MKNSKDYSKKVQALYRTLSRKYPKVEQVSNKEVTDAIIYAIIASELNEKAASSAVRRLGEHFVDWNDLRVSQSDQIVEALRKDTRATRNVASTLAEVLNGIFNQYHKVSLEALKKTGKRPAKQALEKIDGVSRFVVDYCMLTSLHGHAIPLTKKMLEYLMNNELVDPNADEAQIAGFLAKQIPAKNGYDFYALLRRESEASKNTKKKNKTGKKAKVKSKSKTAKKTRKKTVRRKKT